MLECCTRALPRLTQTAAGAVAALGLGWAGPGCGLAGWRAGRLAVEAAGPLTGASRKTKRTVRSTSAWADGRHQRALVSAVVLAAVTEC